MADVTFNWGLPTSLPLKYDSPDLMPRLATTPSKKLEEYRVRYAANEQGFDPHVAAAVALQESGFNPTATSPTGVKGTMQLTKKTGLSKGYDRDNPDDNIRGGIATLKDGLNKYPDPKDAPKWVPNVTATAQKSRDTSPLNFEWDSPDTSDSSGDSAPPTEAPSFFQMFKDSFSNQAEKPLPKPNAGAGHGDFEKVINAFPNVEEGFLDENKAKQAVATLPAQALAAAGPTLGGIAGLGLGGPLGAIAGAAAGGFASEKAKQGIGSLFGNYKTTDDFITPEAAYQGSVNGLAAGVPFVPEAVGNAKNAIIDPIVNLANKLEVPENLYGRATGLFKHPDFKTLEKSGKGKEIIRKLMTSLPGGAELPSATQSALDDANQSLRTAEEGAAPVSLRQVRGALFRQMPSVASSEGLSAAYPDKVEGATSDAIDRLNAISGDPSVTTKNFATGSMSTPDVPSDDILKEVYKTNKAQAMAKKVLPLNENEAQAWDVYNRSSGDDLKMTPPNEGTMKQTKFPGFKAWKTQELQDLQPTEETYQDKVIPTKLLSQAKRDLAERVAKSYEPGGVALSNEDKLATRALADTFRGVENDVTGGEIGKLNKNQNSLRMMKEAVAEKLFKDKTSNLSLGSRVTGPIIGGAMGGPIGAAGALGAEEGVNTVLAPTIKKGIMNAQTKLAKSLYKNPNAMTKLNKSLDLKKLIEIILNGEK